MTNKEFKELLKANTNMTDYDIKRQIELGFDAYRDCDKYDFIKEFANMYIDEEEGREEALQAWNAMEVIGGYRVDFYC